MGAKLDSNGDIEIICDTTNVRPGLQAKLTFRTWSDSPPYKIKVWSPTGNLIVDRVIRVLPTGAPQSPPPVTFSVHKGRYKMRINELHGKAEGVATLDVHG